MTPDLARQLATLNRRVASLERPKPSAAPDTAGVVTVEANAILTAIVSGEPITLTDSTGRTTIIPPAARVVATSTGIGVQWDWDQAETPTPPTEHADGLLTEDGEPLLAESGDEIITED